jgi:hypothetical protein
MEAVALFLAHIGLPAEHQVGVLAKQERAVVECVPMFVGKELGVPAEHQMATNE